MTRSPQRVSSLAGVRGLALAHANGDSAGTINAARACPHPAARWSVVLPIVMDRFSGYNVATIVFGLIRFWLCGLLFNLR